MWFQWDYTDGPRVNGRPTLLYCAWLAWSRFRVILPIWDRSLPTVLACLDATVRRFGGCPTYALTDNEKTVTVIHIAGIAVRNANMVAAARHYGLTIADRPGQAADRPGAPAATASRSPGSPTEAGHSC